MVFLKSTGVLIVLGVLGVLIMASAYTIREGEQVIITQFGKPIGDPIIEAGLHFRIPFAQKVRKMDRRILNWDGAAKMINTKGQKYIKVDTTARWRIIDPLLFLQSLQNMRIARSRLDDIIDGDTRKVISANALVELVRNTDQIIEDAKNMEDDQVMGSLEKVSIGREKLSELILESARPKVKAMGIELIDVLIKRISYEKSVEEKVYERMISERMRIAEKIRSIGKGERAKIEGKISKELQKIESEAYRKAQLIRGTADAEATRIYASAFKKDPGFFRFVRTLEAYKKTFKEDTRFIFSSGSKFFRLLQSK